jgi:S1-C subfamily serine protease
MVCVGCLLGCSSAPLVLPQRSALLVKGQSTVKPRPRGTIFRDELEQALAVGLGHFLQHVDLRAVTRLDDSGRARFVGFEILSLRPARDWLEFDFAPGDIVTRIDGVSVEHYENVVPMVEALARKDRFEVAILRGGEQKNVVVNVADRPAAK